MIVFAIFAFTSCGSGSTTTEKSESDSTVVDSVDAVVDTTAVVADTTVVL